MTHPQVVRAISIRQPYVELILLGVKKREYRSIPTNIRERVYIYASLKHGEDWEKNAHHLDGAKPGDLPTGVIVGTVEIAGCEWNDKTREYEYILKNPVRFKKPLKAINQPQPVFWRPKFQ